MDTSGNDHCFNLSLFASGARINPIPRAFCHRKGLTCQCRLQGPNRGIAGTYGLTIRRWNRPTSNQHNNSRFKSTWSIFNGSPSRRRASAGIMSPSLTLIMSPGTRTDASSSLHLPSRRTYIFFFCFQNSISILKDIFHKYQTRIDDMISIAPILNNLSSDRILKATHKTTTKGSHIPSLLGQGGPWEPQQHYQRCFPQ